jgi:hypothetical protein
MLTDLPRYVKVEQLARLSEVAKRIPHACEFGVLGHAVLRLCEIDQCVSFALGDFESDPRSPVEGLLL